MKNVLLIAILSISYNLKSQVLVKNLAPGLIDGNPTGFFRFDQNRIVFFAWDGSTSSSSTFGSNGLYITDGTSSGTLLLKNHTPTSLSSQGNAPQNQASSMGFTKIDTLGYVISTIQMTNYPVGSLIRTNGTPSGTSSYSFSILTSFTLGVAESITRFFKLGSNICWIYKNTAPNNQLMKLYNYNVVTNQISFVNIPNYYYDYNYGILKHRTIDNSGTRGILSNLSYPPGVSPSDPVIEDVLTSGNYFYTFKRGWGTTQDSLFKIDVNGARTTVTTTAYGVISNYGVVVNDKYLFPGSNASLGMEPYYLNLSNDNFGILKDINPYFNYSSNPKFILLPFDKKEYNHKRIYFTADHADYGIEMWTTDGTGSGTYMVQDYRPGPLSSNFNYAANNNYMGDSLITGWDTVRLITPNSIISYGVRAASDFYFWRNGTNAFTINDLGVISKLGFSANPRDTLSKLNCNPQGYTPSNIGSVMELNNCLILNQRDCSFTGDELYKYCNNSLYSGVKDQLNLPIPVSVFPNPSTSQYNFKGLVGENTIQIADVTGRILICEETVKENYTLKLDAAKGIYFYTIIDKQNRIQQGKIVLQ